jgi:signal transduction histidine kinase
MGQQHQFESLVEIEPATIQADPWLLRLILTNLFSNAVKYSPTGSMISLKALRDEADGSVKIQLCDQGIGIVPSDRDRIFEPFFRGSNFDERPGLGIGLSIVMNAVKAHRGQIELTSTGESGTCFTLTIPSAQ